MSSAQNTREDPVQGLDLIETWERYAKGDVGAAQVAGQMTERFARALARLVAEFVLSPWSLFNALGNGVAILKHSSMPNIALFMVIAYFTLWLMVVLGNISLWIINNCIWIPWKVVASAIFFIKLLCGHVSMQTGVEIPDGPTLTFMVIVGSSVICNLDANKQKRLEQERQQRNLEEQRLQADIRRQHKAEKQQTWNTQEWLQRETLKQQEDDAELARIQRERAEEVNTWRRVAWRDLRANRYNPPIIKYRPAHFVPQEQREMLQRQVTPRPEATKSILKTPQRLGLAPDPSRSQLKKSVTFDVPVAKRSPHKLVNGHLVKPDYASYVPVSPRVR